MDSNAPAQHERETIPRASGPVARRAEGPAPTISVVIPVYHEADRINALIEDLRRLDTDGCTELIVVDGGPDGDTIAAVRDTDTRRLSSAAGRGRQMNAGAAVARGDVLLFLHADTRLPPGAFAGIAEAVSDPKCVGGAFGLAFESARRWVRFLGWLLSVRSRLTRLPFGDHAIFVRRSYFERIGGYRDIPIMEDVDLVRRIRQAGQALRVLDQRVRTSARRFEREGVTFCTLRNCALLALFYLGVPPERLQRYYRYD